jgi:hypothetical protein
MNESRIFWETNIELNAYSIKNYISNAVPAASSFLVHLIFEWSPFALALGALGLFSLHKQHPATAKVIFILGASYLIPVLCWASFKYRFLVPILPIAFIFTAMGCRYCQDRGGLWPNFAKLAMTGTFAWFGIAWIVTIILTGSPTRYYAFDMKHKEDYSEMVIFANKVSSLEKGTIIGSAKSLDGGIEGVYIHKFPYIAARGFPWEYIVRLRKDFDATYFWTDDFMKKSYGKKLENMEIVLSHGKFHLLRFNDSD